MDSIVKLYNTHYKALIKFLVREGETLNNAEDILGDVFLKLLSNPNLYDPRKSFRPNSFSFLWQCAINRRIDYARFGYNKHELNADLIDWVDEKDLPVSPETEVDELYNLTIECIPKCLDTTEQRLVDFICLRGNTYIAAAKKYKTSLKDITYRYRLAKVKIQRYMMLHHPNIVNGRIKSILNGNKASWTKCKKLIQTEKHDLQRICRETLTGVV